MRRYWRASACDLRLWQKQHVWVEEWVGGLVCTRACVRFFRESIIVIASCHGTVRNSKTTINRFFSLLPGCRTGESVCGCCVVLFERRLVVGGGWLGLLS